MSNFDSDNDFIQDDYYETNGNFYTSGGIYQGEKTWKINYQWNFPEKSWLLSINPKSLEVHNHEKSSIPSD